MYICSDCGLSGLNCHCVENPDYIELEEEQEVTEDDYYEDEDCPVCAGKLDADGCCTVCFWS